MTSEHSRTALHDTAGGGRDRPDDGDDSTARRPTVTVPVYEYVDRSSPGIEPMDASDLDPERDVILGDDLAEEMTALDGGCLLRALNRGGGARRLWVSRTDGAVETFAGPETDLAVLEAVAVECTRGTERLTRSCADPVWTGMETETMHNLARWLYRSLEAAWNNETSDESVQKAINANGWAFRANGAYFAT